MLKKTLFIVIFSVLFFYSCQENESFPPVPELFNTGKFYQDTLYAVEDTFLVQGKVNTAKGSKLLLGSYMGYEARMLVRFTLFPADTIDVDSVRLILKSISNFGEPSSSIRGTVYLLNEDWEESINGDVSENFLPDYDPSPVTSTEFELSNEDSIYSILLPDTLVDIWRDTTGGNHNYGLLIDFDEADHIKEFTAWKISYPPDPLEGPLLIYKYGNEEGETVQDTIDSNRDAALIDLNDVNGIFDHDRLFVASGFTAHTFLKFNLDTIPKTAIIASANLLLKKDENYSIINENKDQKIYLRNITSDYNLLKSPYPSFELDSIYVTSTYYPLYLEEKDGGRFEIDNSLRRRNAVDIFQLIINESVIEHGAFYLEYEGEGSDISVCAFVRSNDGNVNNRPKLIISYYIDKNN